MSGNSDAFGFVTHRLIGMVEDVGYAMQRFQALCATRGLDDVAEAVRENVVSMATDDSEFDPDLMRLLRSLDRAECGDDAPEKADAALASWRAARGNAADKERLTNLISAGGTGRPDAYVLALRDDLVRTEGFAAPIPAYLELCNNPEPENFAQIVLSGLGLLPVSDLMLAQHASASLTTVKRWAKGKAIPHRTTREAVTAYLRDLAARTLAEKTRQAKTLKNLITTQEEINGTR